MGAATEEKVRTKTSYLVLQKVEVSLPSEDGSTGTVAAWSPLGTAEGNTDIDAIKAATTKAKLEEGTFVAIPGRSFRERSIAVQTQRKVSIS